VSQFGASERKNNKSIKIKERELGASFSEKL